VPPIGDTIGLKRSATRWRLPIRRDRKKDRKAPAAVPVRSRVPRIPTKCHEYRRLSVFGDLRRYLRISGITNHSGRTVKFGLLMRLFVDLRSTCGPKSGGGLDVEPAVSFAIPLRSGDASSGQLSRHWASLCDGSSGHLLAGECGTSCLQLLLGSFARPSRLRFALPQLVTLNLLLREPWQLDDDRLHLLRGQLDQAS